MRVIGGKAKGTNLFSLKGLNTRPTLDRVKESLFNIIQFDIKDANVLDLFSGSGALGIEALSRGAKAVTFCDNSSDAIKIISKNLISTKFNNIAEVINKDYSQALKLCGEKNKKFNIIFLDPPYESDFVIKSINGILELKLIAKDGIIIVETDDKNKEDEILNIKNIEIYDKRKYGRVWLIFIRKG